MIGWLMRLLPGRWSAFFDVRVRVRGGVRR